MPTVDFNNVDSISLALGAVGSTMVSVFIFIMLQVIKDLVPGISGRRATWALYAICVAAAIGVINETDVEWATYGAILALVFLSGTFAVNSRGIFSQVFHTPLAREARKAAVEVPSKVAENPPAPDEPSQAIVIDDDGRTTDIGADPPSQPTEDRPTSSRTAPRSRQYVTYKDKATRRVPSTPFPLGELRADDSRDNDHRMEDRLSVGLTAPPPYLYYDVYDGGLAKDARSIYQNTPLNQSNCHSKTSRTAKDPLGCGHCVGYANKHLLLVRRPVLNVAPTLSGSDVYHLAQTLDEWSGTNYQGTSVRAGLKALQKLGYGGEYVWTSDVMVVANWLLSGRGPVIVGTDWHTGMFTPSASGFIRPTGSVVGGHCYLFDGCNAVEKKLRILNSWGAYWGTNGRAWITFADAQTLMGRRPNAAASFTEWAKVT